MPVGRICSHAIIIHVDMSVKMLFRPTTASAVDLSKSPKKGLTLESIGS